MNVASRWSMDGKCGVCGDRTDGPRNNETPNSKYLTSITTYTYKAGSVIDVRVEMMANHMGWFFFKISPVTNSVFEVTQEYLNRYPLEIAQAPTIRYRWGIPVTYIQSIAPDWDLPLKRQKFVYIPFTEVV